MKLHVETVARDLLAQGWHPAPERCFVGRDDGASPRLIDYDVWRAMHDIEAKAAPPTGSPHVGRAPPDG